MCYDAGMLKQKKKKKKKKMSQLFKGICPIVTIFCTPTLLKKWHIQTVKIQIRKKQSDLDLQCLPLAKRPRSNKESAL